MSESAEQLERQISYYLRKYELSPHSRVFAPLADLYRKVGRVDEAVEILTAGLADHPQYVSALVILGRCHLDAARTGEAREAFDRVLGLDPDNLVALKQLAALAQAGGEVERAAELLGRVVQLDPTDDRAEAELSALRGPQQVPAAAAPLAASPPNPPRTAPAPSRADSLVVGAAGSDAEPSPNRERQAFATKTLAEIYLAQGYREKALAVLRQILQRHPDRDDVSVLIASIEGQQSAATVAAESARPTPPASGPTEQRNRVHFESWLQKVSKADGEA